MQPVHFSSLVGMLRLRWKGQAAAVGKNNETKAGLVFFFFLLSPNALSKKKEKETKKHQPVRVCMRLRVCLFVYSRGGSMHIAYRPLQHFPRLHRMEYMQTNTLMVGGGAGGEGW